MDGFFLSELYLSFLTFVSQANFLIQQMMEFGVCNPQISWISELMNEQTNE